MARSLRLGIVLTSLTLASVAIAASNGISGNSGRENRTCNSCHGQSNAPMPQVTLTGPLALEAGTRATYTFRIQTDAAATGFNAAASEGRLTGNPDAGVQNFDDEVTHTSPRRNDGGTGTSYTFDLVAPQYGGTITLFAAGNAVNLDRENTGDTSARAQIDIVIDGPPKPTPPPPPPATTRYSAKKPPAPQVDSGVKPVAAPSAAPTEEDDGGCTVGHGTASPFGAALGVLVAALAFARGRRRVTR